MVIESADLPQHENRLEPVRREDEAGYPRLEVLQAVIDRRRAGAILPMESVDEFLAEVDRIPSSGRDV